MVSEPVPWGASKLGVSGPHSSPKNKFLVTEGTLGGRNTKFLVRTGPTGPEPKSRRTMLDLLEIPSRKSSTLVRFLAHHPDQQKFGLPTAPWQPWFAMCVETTGQHVFELLSTWISVCKVRKKAVMWVLGVMRLWLWFGCDLQ